ncbi:response regulator transcription factor [Vibrio alginolyticus]|uniref:response regulator transcription factor n=2 Tax=Vibrio alginolyticus TaxID=663 RepID=UPI00301B8760
MESNTELVNYLLCRKIPSLVLNLLGKVMQSLLSLNVVIIEPQPLVAEAISLRVKQVLTNSRVITLEKVSTALKYIRNNDVHLLIVDLEASDGCNFELVNRIKCHDYKTKVLFYAASDNEQHAKTALEVGANGYISRFEPLTSFDQAVVSILSGFNAFREFISVHNEDKALSQRELTVLSYLKKGLKNKEISEKLMLSEKTISTYKKRIMSKLAVKNIVELIAKT